MDYRTIAAIALTSRDFPKFEDKLKEAARWVRFAAEQGADLAVLPEALNIYRGDGPGNPPSRANWLRQAATAFPDND